MLVGDLRRLRLALAARGRGTRACGRGRRSPRARARGRSGSARRRSGRRAGERSCSSVAKKSARSRSSIVTKTTRQRPSASARSQRRVVCTSTPLTPLTAKSAPSTTRSEASVSAWKPGSPGVSTRLIFRSCHCAWQTEADSDICRRCSSSSQSETVEEPSTEPRRLVAPAWKSIASTSEVLPRPPVADDGDVPDLCSARTAARVGEFTDLPATSREDAEEGLARFRSSPGCDGRSEARTQGALVAGALRARLRTPHRGDQRGPATQPLSRRTLLARADECRREPRLEAEDRLRVQLGDPRLGHAEHLADLAEGQLLVVVERDDELLALRAGGRSPRRAPRAARCAPWPPAARPRPGPRACRSGRRGRRRGTSSSRARRARRSTSARSRAASPGTPPR